MDSVRGDGQVVSLGQVGDLHPGRDASAVRQIRFWECYRSCRDHGFEFGQGVQVLACGDRQRAFALDAHMAVHIGRIGRLFEPVDVKFCQRPRCPDRFGHAPFHVRVHHERAVRAEDIPESLDSFEVVPQAVASDLHFQRSEPPSQVRSGLVHQLVQRESQVDPPGVGADRRRAAAQQPPQRLGISLCFRVPQGRVHGRDGEAGGAAPADIVRRLPHVGPDGLGAAQVSARKQRR